MDILVAFYHLFLCKEIWGNWKGIYFVIQVLNQYLYSNFHSLETNGRLMELDTKTGELVVNYGDRLVTLMREVRQLTGLGYAVPAKIQHVSNTAQKFYRHGCILKQVITVTIYMPYLNDERNLQVILTLKPPIATGR